MARGGSKPGQRRGGRPKGGKNKATIEREQRALEALQKQAKQPLRKLAKDQLADLVPEVKGIVSRFAAAVEEKGGKPGTKGYKRELWRELKDWIRLYGWVADLAADFESPRYRAVAVAMTPGDGKPMAPIIEHESANAEERERAANQSYLRLVKGGS
jgi:hypothetical protein